MSAFIQTFLGGRFYPLEPRTQDIYLTDIAHALSQLCRFTGHSRDFYSIAEHSVRVSFACDPNDALWGLLHDASEAYLADISSPLKRTETFEKYRAVEAALMQRICQRYDLQPEMPESVKRADLTLLATEARDLMVQAPENWCGLPAPLPGRIMAWAPKEAEQRFHDRFNELIWSAK